ncbi:MAG: GPALPP motifs-containing protein 1 [Synergistaceae bacterium]|jgi:hypothetical protein|nr:GPALPP motifs-containing protein 1 [Synergistaceae bacterium]
MGGISGKRVYLSPPHLGGVLNFLSYNILTRDGTRIPYQSAGYGGDSGRDPRMSVSNINGNAQMEVMSAMARERAGRGAKRAGEPERERALEAFRDALKVCDKTAEQMMDKHHESVKKSAEKLAEYHKKKDAAERAWEREKDMRDVNEEILAERINYRDMLEELRLKAMGRGKNEYRW